MDISPAALKKSGKVEELLKKVGALQEGHFLLSSGLHSNQYMQCQRIMQYPRYGLELAAMLVEAIGGAGIKPACVVGPALGAVHWELLVAQALDRLSEGEPVRAVFAEKCGPEEKFAIRRGIEIKPGEPVLAVEDVTTTGNSVQKVIELVQSLGGNVVACATIVDRSGGKAKFAMPFFSLLKADLAAYESADCPMCRQGMPLIKPGSGKKSA